MLVSGIVFTVDSSEEVAVAIVRPSNNKIQRMGAAIHYIRTMLLPPADHERSTAQGADTEKTINGEIRNMLLNN